MDSTCLRNCISRDVKVMRICALVLSSALAMIGTEYLPKDCSLIDDTLTCQRSVPKLVPDNITKVYVKEYIGQTISPENFNDISWVNVTTLDVVVMYYRFSILSYTFQALRNLEYLGIHGGGIRNMGKHAFAGLWSLQRLDISGCTRLNQEPLFQNMLDDIDTLQNLISLKLNNLHSANYGPFFLDDIVYKVLKSIPIQFLFLSGTNMVFTGSNLTCTTVWYLDISNTTWSKTANFNPFKEETFSFLSSLRFLNASYADIPALFADVSVIDASSDAGNCWVGSITTIIATKILSSLVFNNVTIDVSYCANFSLQEIHLQQNGMQKLNATFILPKNNPLRYLDLGFNKLVYLSPGITQYATSLEVIILSNNNLVEMESYIEFEMLFTRLSKLSHLDLSMNRLTRIPSKMFIRNTQMQELDLSGNQLNAITFNLSTFKRLAAFRLRSNNILYLDHTVIWNLNEMLLRLSDNNISTKVDFSINPFECSCRSIAFLQWIVDRIEQQITEEDTCSLDGNNIILDQEAVEKSKQLCKSTILARGFWIMLTIYLISISSLLIMIVKFYRKQNLEILINYFIQDFKEGKIKHKYFVFLSENFDSDNQKDEEIFSAVSNGMLKELSKVFGDEWNDDMLQSDNLNGRAGLYRDEVTNMVMAECCVIVLLQSVSDPENQHFKTDLELAKANKRPVCLLSPRVKDGTQHVINYYSRYPAIDLEYRDGVWEPAIGWAGMCKSIVDMAVKDQYQKANKSGYFNPILLLLFRVRNVLCFRQR